MKTTITKKGQVIIPAKIRHRYHIQPGQQFEVDDRGKEIVLIPLQTISIKEAKGWFVSTKSAKYLLEESRREENTKG